MTSIDSPDWEAQFFSQADYSDEADNFTGDEWYDDGYTDIPEDYIFEPEIEEKASDTKIPLGLLEGMNEPQSEAVQTLIGPLMVVAGPGSGKTRVLTHRVAALVATGLAKPWQVLAVTFTNKAAAEMRERISALVGSAADDMWVCTFHSACVRMLRANASAAELPKAFSIVDSNDSQKVIKSVLTDLGMASEKSDVKEVSSIISRAKNAAMTSTALASTYDAWAAPAMDAYNDRLASMGAIDFDDILLKTLKLLNGHPDVRERYQRKFKFVLVDEYQDTNAVQYQITQILAAASKNLCVVGDLDQSVYSWRGASPEAMGGFPADYPSAKVVILEQNYRSTKAIVETYKAIIDSNPAIHRPRLFTDNDAGEPVRMVVAPDDREEAAFVVSEIKQKPAGESTAILMRTNTQTRVFEEALSRNAIPYSVVGALRFYDRAEVKDALSYLRFALNPLDAVSFARCVNTPRRGIGDSTVANVTLRARENGTDIITAINSGIDEGVFKGRAASALKKFVEINAIVTQACSNGPSAALQAVSTDAGMHDALAADKSEGPDRVANLEELISGAAAFIVSNNSTNPDVRNVSTLSGIEQTMAYVENVALVSSADGEDTISSHKAILLTAHSSKGKEFDHVWVVGVEDSLFPHSRSQGDQESLEEERRLLFVACSRPRLTLTISRARQRMTYGKVIENAASIFLGDLPESVKRITLKSRGWFGNPSYGNGPRMTPVTPARIMQSGSSSFSGGQKARTQVPRGPRISKDDAKVGLIVDHVIFGQGVIEALDGMRANIRFNDNLRILDLEIAPLTKV